MNVGGWGGEAGVDDGKRAKGERIMTVPGLVYQCQAQESHPYETRTSFMIQLGKNWGIIPASQSYLTKDERLHMHEKGLFLNKKTFSNPAIFLGIFSSHLKMY